MTDSDLIARAEAFARERHKGQVRKGEAQEPYEIHLEEVAVLVESFGGDAQVIAAAWLHDTVEDCPPTTLEELAELFGERVASLVGELTDDKSLPKAERKRLQVENAAHKTPDASLIKLADKTSNLRALAKSPPADWSAERRQTYIQWGREVVARLPYRPAEALKTFEEAAREAEVAIKRDFAQG